MGLIKGNPERDFFDQNPEVAYFEPFAKVKKEEKNASKICWAIFMREDPNSDFYRIPENQREEEIKKNYLKDEKFEFEDYKYLIDAWPRYCLEKEEAMFKIWGDKLDQLTQHVRTLDPTIEKEEKRLVTIMEKMTKIWDAYDAVKSRMIESEQKGKIRGGSQESAREKRKRKR